MKRIFLFGISLLSFLILLAACSNMTLFNKIQVKAAPSIYAPFGGTKVVAEDFLTIEKISEMLGKDSAFKVYGYTGDAGSAAMTFLMEYPIVDMPLNFDEYLGKLDMSKMDTSIPEMDFSIPTFDLELKSQIVAVPGGENFAGRTLDSSSAQVLNQAVGQGKSLSIEERTVTVKSEGLRSAVFADGNKITLSLQPTVEGISISSTDISIAMPGSSTPIKFEADANKPGSYTADLGCKTVSNGDLVIKGRISVSAAVQAGARVPAEGVGVRVNMGLDLNQGFASATIDVPAGTNLEQTISTPLPEEMTKLVSRITFNSVGAAVTLENGLPPGNDISVTVSSTTLSIADKEETFPASVTTSKKFLGQDVSLQPSITPSIDMKMKVELPGHDSAENTFTVQNVKPGQQYSVGGSVAFDVDWKEATVKTDKPYEGTYPAEGTDPMSLDDLWKKIPAGISFKNIGAYLYMGAPMEVTMKGYMTMNNQSLWGTETAQETMVKKAVPAAPAEGDWTERIDPSQASADLSAGVLEIVNGRPQSLSFKYSLTADQATVQKNQVSGDDSLKAVLILLLPMELEVDSSKMKDQPASMPFAEKGVLIDLLTMMSKESDGEKTDEDKDLLGRSEAWSSNEEIDKLMEQVKSMKMEVDYTNDYNMSLGAWLYDAATGIGKHFTLEQGQKKVELDFTVEEFKKILETYSFNPKLYAFVPDTTPEKPFVLNRDGGLDFKLTAAAFADVDLHYELKGGER